MEISGVFLVICTVNMHRNDSHYNITLEEARHCWRCKSGAFRGPHLSAHGENTADSRHSLTQCTTPLMDGKIQYMTGFLPCLPHRLHFNSKTEPHRDRHMGRGGKERENSCSYVSACVCSEKDTLMEDGGH